MKRVILILISVCLTLSLAACGGGQGGTDEEYSVWKTTYSESIKSLNPFDANSSTLYKLAANSQSGLLEVNKYGAIAPSLAESYENNEDFTEWTFYLKQGLKWVDNQGNETEYPITAHDFVFGAKYVADARNQMETKAALDAAGIVGLEEYEAALSDAGSDEAARKSVQDTFDDVVGIEAVDDYTLKYTLVNGKSYFPTLVLDSGFYPLNEDFYNTQLESFATKDDKILYSGPWYIESWDVGYEIMFKANTHYHDTEGVFLDAIHMRKADTDSGLRLFQQGELSSVTLSGQELVSMQNSSKWSDKIYLTDKGKNTYWTALNFGKDYDPETGNMVDMRDKDKYLNQEFNVFVTNSDFRRALYHAFPKEDILYLDVTDDAREMIRNTVTPETYLSYDGVDYTDFTVTPDFEGYPSISEIKREDTYNPDLAREYMVKALEAVTGGSNDIPGAEPQTIRLIQGGTNGEMKTDGMLPIDILYIHDPDTEDANRAAVFKSKMEEIFTINGEKVVNIVLGSFVSDSFTEVIEPNRFDIVYDSFGFKFADPAAQLDRLDSDGAVNDGGFSDPYFDELIAAAVVESDLQLRYELFAKAEAYLLEEAYIIPWACTGGSYVMSRAVPFTGAPSTFGIAGYSYKGVQLQDEPVTKAQYIEAQEAWENEKATLAD